MQTFGPVCVYYCSTCTKLFAWGGVFRYQNRHTGSEQVR
jgi:hypothetical protein